MITISRHAYKRSSERSGLGKKATDRMVEKVWNNGILAENTVGGIRHWTRELYNHSENRVDAIILYGDKAYLFSGDFLITIIQIPVKYMKTMNSIRHKVVRTCA